MVTRWAIIHLEICLKGISSWVYQTSYLAVWLNCEISSTCSILDAQFRDMKISAIYFRRGSKFLSSRIRGMQVYLVNLFNSIFNLFIFEYLIILTMANIMCWDMVFRKPIALMCMRSHHRVTFLYLSRIPMRTFVIMIGSTCCILWWTALPWKCGTLGP